MAAVSQDSRNYGHNLPGECTGTREAWAECQLTGGTAGRPPGAPAVVVGWGMTEFRATTASTHRNVLAEGPVWAAGTIYWVDIEAGQVFEGQLQGDRVEQTARHDFDGTVGAVAVAADGQLLVAERERLVVVSPAGERTPGPRIVPAGANRRTNDGACDPAGRFLIGTLSLGDESGTETLVRVEDDGTLTTLDDDLALSNGLAWSPDGRLLYSIDTIPGVVWVRDYDAASGAIGPRREHLRVTDGSPDGMCIDERGYLWIAIWGAGEVRSFSPTGEHMDTVHVNAPHTSSVAFVGPELDVLLITTASRDLSAPELEAYPDAGKLFTARVGVRGTPCAPWAGAPAGWS